MEPLDEEELYEKEARWFDAERRVRELIQENQELRAKLDKQAPVLAQMKDLLDRVDELKDELKSVTTQSNDRQLYIETLLEWMDFSAKARLRGQQPDATPS